MQAENLLGEVKSASEQSRTRRRDSNHARSSFMSRSAIDSSGDFQRALVGVLLLLRDRDSIRLSGGGEIAGGRIRTAALSGSGL